MFSCNNPGVNILHDIKLPRFLYWHICVKYICFSVLEQRQYHHKFFCLLNHQLYLREVHVNYNHFFSTFSWFWRICNINNESWTAFERIQLSSHCKCELHSRIVNALCAAGPKGIRSLDSFTNYATRECLQIDENGITVNDLLLYTFVERESLHLIQCSYVTHLDVVLDEIIMNSEAFIIFVGKTK